jgi:hypothetical protein
MARSDEAEWWFDAVYSAAQEIPPGKVTTYAHIARLLGRRMPHLLSAHPLYPLTSQTLISIQILTLI